MRYRFLYVGADLRQIVLSQTSANFCESARLRTRASV